MIMLSLVTSIVVIISSLNASAASSAKPSMAQNATNSMAAFFNNMPPANLFPSDLTTAVNQIYKTSLQLPPTLLGPINQLYSLLAQQSVREYITKSNPTLFSSLATAQTALAKAQAAGDTQDMQNAQTTITNLTSQINAVIKANSSELNSICTKSSCWQNYLKLFVANSFDYEVTLLTQLHTNEQQTFVYIPSFETAYYTDAYVKLRNGAETMRIFLVITDQIRNRMLPLITDWATLTNDQVYDALTAFKETDFYTAATAFHQSLTAEPVAVTAPLVANNNIAPGFTTFLHLENNQPTVIPGLQSMMTITNNQLMLTNAGTVLFKQTTITDKNGNSYPTLTPTPLFELLFTQNGAALTPTDLYLDLLIIEGVKQLIGATSYLFNAENVADTMQKLATLSPAYRGISGGTTNIFPHFLLYQPEDQLFLEDLATCIATNNQLNPDNQLTPENFWHSFTHAFRHAFIAIGKGFESFGEQVASSIANITKKVGDFVVHIATAVADVGKAFYYVTGLNCIVSGIAGDGFNHYSMANFNKYLADSASQLSDCIDDITSVITDVASVASSVVNLTATIVGQVAGAVFMDPQLANDLTGLIDQIADTVINLTANSINFFVKAIGDVVVLSYEAVETLARVIVDTLTGNVALAGKALGQMLSSVVSSILNMATFVISSLSSALKSVMAAVAYLVASITDVITDVAGYLAALFTGNWSENDLVRHKIGEHRQLINALIMTGLAVAITVATFGAGAEVGAGMIALAIAGGVMTAGMSVLQIMSAVQQDNQTVEKNDDQINFLKKYEPYVTNNARVTASNQAKVYAESLLKFEAQANNKERGLVYYQNYLNQYYNNFYALQAYGISSFYNTITTPDSSTGPNPGIAPADPGYWYGIVTNRLDLNPSRGLRVYQQSTNSFTQAVAVAPAPSSPPTTLAGQLMISPGQQSTSQAWLNQRDTSPATQADLQTIDVRWRIIYDMDAPFYVGIYITEKYIDTNQLHALHTNFQAQQTGITNQTQFTPTWQALSAFNRALLEFNTDAKCFVMYKGMDQATPIIGLYENSAKGWLTTNTTALTYERGAWYRMTANLQPGSGTTSQLQVQCWKESVPNSTYQQAASKWSYSTTVTRAQSTTAGIPTSGWSITPATPTTPSQPYAGSFGVITSGAAVEYQIVSPKPTITPTPARTASDTQTVAQLQSNGINPVEKDRELNWQKNNEQNFYPTFGGQTLSPASTTEIKSGVYIYTTNKTGLSSNPDYVVFLTAPTGLPTTITSSMLGGPITTTPAPTYIVSLITGNVFNTQWQLQTQTYPNALALFQSANSIEPAVVTAITNATATLYKNEAGPFTLSNLTLTGNTAAFATGTFIYTAPSFTPQLNGTDYFITAYYNAAQSSTTATNLPLSPQKPTAINALISLVTGKLFMINQNGTAISAFNANQAKFMSVATTSTTAFPALYSTLQNIPTALQTAINAQQALYQKTINPPTPTTPAQPTQPTTPSNYSYSNYSTGGDFGGLMDSGGNL